MPSMATAGPTRKTRQPFRGHRHRPRGAQRDNGRWYTSHGSCSYQQ